MANKFLNGIDVTSTGSFTGQVTIPETPTADAHAASKKYVDDQVPTGVDVAKRIEISVKNISGGELTKGTVVHAAPSASPPSGNVVEVIAADYDAEANMPAIGILNETLADDAEGVAVMMGAVSGIDTDDFTAGDELYVGADGALTNTKPQTAGQLIQKIAVCVKSHASNGLIKVFGAGRSNDVPLPLYIDNTNQRLGIGTTTPNAKLDIQGTQGQLFSVTDDLSGEIFAVSDISGVPIMTVNSNGVSYFDGNVGIGTTSPGEKLEVAGDMNLYNPSNTSQINFRNISNSNYIKSNGYSTHFGLRGNLGNGQFIIENNLDTSQDIRIKPATSGWTISTRGVAGANSLLTIDTVLNVSNKTNIGIGTTNPGRTLDVVGRGRFVDNNASVDILSSNYVPLLITHTNGYAHARINGFEVGGETTANNEGYIKTADNSRVLKLNTDGWLFKVTSAEKMRLTPSGNLGIGTTSPQQKLHVEGTIRIGSDVDLTRYAGQLYTAQNIVLGSMNSETANITVNASPTKSVLGVRRPSSGTVSILKVRDYSAQDLYVDIDSDGNGYFAGNVGIGTTTPSDKLSVAGNLSTFHSGYTTKALRVTMNSNDTLLSLYSRANQSSQQVLLRTNGNSYLNGGNVGIGTTNPLELLHLESTEPLIRFDDTNSGLHYIIGQDGDGFKFTTNNSTYGKYTFDSNVGIGTTNPSEKLDVVGGSLRVNSETGREATLTGFELLFSRNSVNYIYATDSAGSIRIVTGGNVQGSDPTADFKSNKDSIFYGNVGIGTTSPAAKLNVNGNVKIEGTNALLFGGSASIPSWAINHNGSDLLIDDQGGNTGSVLFNNSEGVALPRLTTTEINAISLPAQGLMAYNTTLNTICFYNGSSWQKVSHTNM